MLAISTDMQTPKDIDVVSVFIATDGVAKFNYLGRVLPNGTVALPSTVAIVEPDDPDAKVRIRVTAFQEANARVLRDVLTTVPHQETALLRLPLNLLDDGSGKGTIPPMLVPLGPGGAPEGDTAFDPTKLVSRCDFTKGLTSVDGVCVSASVDSSKLPPYDPVQVYGDAGLMANGAPTSCFDVQRCFEGATEVANLDPKACSFPLPAGASPSTLNLALGTPSTGACVPSGPCYVPLVNDPGDGWTVQGSTVTVPAGVCAKLGGSMTLAVSLGACPAATLADPVCEPIDGGGAPPTDAAADRGNPPDSGEFEAELPDAEPDEAEDAPPGVDAADDTGVDATIAAGNDATIDGGGDATTDAGADATADASDDTGPPDGTADSTPPDAGACPGTQTVCASQCVDTSSDSSNCGSCGTTCAGTCVLGRCQVILTSRANSPAGMTRDANNVYWADGQLGAILRTPSAGGPVTTLVSGRYNPQEVAVDGVNVYWVENWGAVYSMPLAGGPVTGLGGSASDSDGEYMTVAGGNVYWTTTQNCPADGGLCGSDILMVPVGGGQVVTISDGYSPSGLIADATHIYWSDTGNGTGAILSAPLGGGTVTTLQAGRSDPTALTLASSNLYWVEGSGDVVTAAVDGGSVTTLASTFSGGSAIAVDSSNVYWVGGTSLNAAPLGGGAVTTLATGLFTFSSGVTVAGGNVYWTASMAGSVYSVPVAGGTETTVASGVSGSGGLSLATDPNNLYAAYSSGAIVEFPFDGGAPATLAVSRGSPVYFAVGPTTAAWSNDYFDELDTVSLAGGTMATLSTNDVGAPVAVDSANAYFGQYQPAALVALPLDGGAAVSLAPAVLAALVVDSQYAYWTEGGTGVADGSIQRVPLTGGSALTIASGLVSPNSLAIDATNVYWVDADQGGSVESAPIGGGTARVLAAGLGGLYGLVVDSASAYTLVGSEVIKVPLGGGAVTTIANNAYRGAVVSSTSVYFVGVSPLGAPSIVQVTPK